MLEVVSMWGVRDPFSALSHLAGALLGVVGVVVLVRRGLRHELPPANLFALLFYGLTVVLAFTASTLFHLFIRPPEELALFKKLDHAAVFLLIGGTCTVMYNAVEARRTSRLLAFTWIVILGALVLKLVIWPMGVWLTSTVYLAVGWIGATGILACARTTGWGQLRLMVGGAVIFTVGAMIFAAEWPVLWPGVVEGHELFHVLVLLGAGCHYLFVYRYCTRPAARRAEAGAATREVGPAAESASDLAAFSS